MHVGRPGELLESIGALHGHANAEIASGQHVRPLQRKHEEHVRGPDADSLYFCEMFHNLFVGHGGEALENQVAVPGEAGEIANISRFRGGKPHLPEGCRAHPQDGFRGDLTIGHPAHQAFDEHPRHLGADLLREDGADERSEVRLAIAHGELADLIDNCSQDGVAPKLLDGLLHSFEETETERNVSPSVKT